MKYQFLIKQKYYELKNKNISSFEIDPWTIITNKYDFKEIVGGDAKYNAEKILEVFNGKEGALLDIISLNVAAGLIVLDQFNSIKDSYLFAKKYIISGKTLNYYNNLKK